MKNNRVEFILIGAAIFFATCGGTISPVVDEVRLKEGKYIAYNNVIWSEGNCGWLYKDLNFYVDIDKDGKVIAPLDLACKTSYTSNSGTNGLDVTCQSTYLNFSGHGTLSDSREFAFGRGILWGNVGGCQKLHVDWSLYLYREK